MTRIGTRIGTCACDNFTAVTLPLYNSLSKEINRVDKRLTQKDERLHAWLIVNETELSLLSTLFVASSGSQWKRIRLIKLWKYKHYFKQTELCYSLLIFLTEVSYERAENELSRNVIFSLKFRYRPPSDILVSSLQIVRNHSSVKYSSYELGYIKWKMRIY